METINVSEDSPPNNEAVERQTRARYAKQVIGIWLSVLLLFVAVELFTEFDARAPILVMSVLFLIVVVLLRHWAWPKTVSHV